MNFRDSLAEGSRRLTEAGCESPYLDALVLLAEAAGTSKERLFACLTDALPEEAACSFERLIEARRSGMPVAYLTHRKEFYGREFYVDERVLIPRPDTEILVEAALEAVAQGGIRRVHDLATGSGCIALTLKAERPELEVSASDSSRAACEVFRINAARLGLAVPLYEAPFFRSLPGPFALIVSNPPYLSEREADAMARAGSREPQEALRSGRDGLDHIAQIIAESVHFLIKGGRLLLEAAPTQAAAVRELMETAGFGETFVVKDLAGRERVIGGVKDG